MICSQLLAELLKSKNPEDLQEANRLIKSMVKEVRYIRLIKSMVKEVRYIKATDSESDHRGRDHATVAVNLCF